MLASIMDSLKTYELFGPLATLIAGSLAIVSVIVNTRSLEKNLTKQIEHQNEQNKNKLLAEVSISNYREKRLKVELLIDELHEYSNQAEQCYSFSNRITMDNELSDKEFLEELKNIREQYRACTQYLSKARVLASSYSDTITDEFDQILAYQEIIKKHYDLIFSIQFDLYTDGELRPDFMKIKQDAYNQKLIMSYQKTGGAIRAVEEVLGLIEAKLITEIKESRKQEVELDRFMTN